MDSQRCPYCLSKISAAVSTCNNCAEWIKQNSKALIQPQENTIRKSTLRKSSRQNALKKFPVIEETNEGLKIQTFLAIAVILLGMLAFTTAAVTKSQSVFDFSWITFSVGALWFLVVKIIGR